MVYDTAEDWLVDGYSKFFGIQLSNTVKDSNGNKKCLHCGFSYCRPDANYCEKCGYPLT